jgi:prepilin peptidase CpaA
MLARPLVRRVLRAEAWRINRRGPLPYAFAIAGGAILTLLPISFPVLR